MAKHAHTAVLISICFTSFFSSFLFFFFGGGGGGGGGSTSFLSFIATPNLHYLV